MTRRNPYAAWNRAIAANLSALARASRAIGKVQRAPAVKHSVARRRLNGAGDWLPGLAIGLSGARRYRLFCPPDARFGVRLPLIVMLHGCEQDAESFATSTRMNRVAARERFFVLYPQQDRLANAQRCWNWFDRQNGRSAHEAASILGAIDQVCLLYPIDSTRIAIAGLSAGASMAAVLATRHPERFRALVMHSGVPPGTAHSAVSAVRAMRGMRPTAPTVASPASMATSWPPLMVIHGERDRVVALQNAEAAARMWADAADAVEATPRKVQRGRRYGATVTAFERGRQTVATLVRVDRLGHAWSGGAADAPFSDHEGPDASRMIWTFASKQFGRGP